MSESCIFIRVVNGEKQIVAVYVDDLVFATRTKESMAELKDMVAKKFKSKDLGPINFILGLKVIRRRSDRKMWISQELNANTIVDKFNARSWNATDTPVVGSQRLEAVPRDQDMSEGLKKKPFRQAVGSLMYLMIGSRPELAYAVQNVSKYLSKYSLAHWEAVKRIIRYVKGTTDHGLEYGGDSVALTAYSDSDYADDTDYREST